MERQGLALSKQVWQLLKLEGAVFPAQEPDCVEGSVCLGSAGRAVSKFGSCQAWSRREYWSGSQLLIETSPHEGDCLCLRAYLHLEVIHRFMFCLLVLHRFSFLRLLCSMC